MEKKWILTKTTEIDAAHKLVGYEGKCSNLHGHRFRVEVKVSSNKLDESGMVVDFVEIKDIINNLDHRYLNDLMSVSPTAENLSKDISEALERKCFGKDIDIVSVKVWETPDASVEYL